MANYESVVRASARLHAWMAAGAIQRRRGGSALTPFQGAHLGWSRYRKWREHISDTELSPLLAESSGAWDAGHALSQAYAQEYRAPVLIVPRSAHYSWKKAARVLGVGEANLEMVGSDKQGRYRVADLKARLERCQRDNQPILAVVSVAGTTETGAVDPIDEIANLLDELRQQRGLHIWHHVDAAFGGFFCSMLRKPEVGPPWPDGDLLRPATLSALAAIPRADSVTLDPHKLGYVPYSSGAFLCPDGLDYTCVRVLAPYLDYGEEGLEEKPRRDLDRGPYTLEGSRSAAGAVSTWLTARAIGLDQAGYGLLLARTIRQKQKLEAQMTLKMTSARILPSGDTNLVCLCVADPQEPVSITNQRTLRILSRLSTESRYYFTKTAFPLTGPQSPMARHFVAGWSGLVDQPQILVLRLCLMNPFFDSSELDVDHVHALVASIRDVAERDGESNTYRE